MMYYLHSMESIFYVVTGEGRLFLIITLYLFLRFYTFSALWSVPMLTGKSSTTDCLPGLCEEAQARCSAGSSRQKY